MRPLFAELLAVALAAAIAGCQDSVTTAGPRGLSEDSPSFSANGSTTQFHFVGKGLAGDASWCDVESNEVYVCGYLSAASGGTTKNPETYLYYDVYRCAPDCNAVEAGYGLIPNGDLSGGPQKLHLSTNTSSNPEFVVWAGTGGLVSVDWRPNGTYTAKWSGTLFVRRIPTPPPCDTLCWPTTQHVNGAWTQTQATAIGTVAGVAIPSRYGNITENHSVTIDIYR